MSAVAFRFATNLHQEQTRNVALESCRFCLLDQRFTKPMSLKNDTIEHLHDTLGHNWTRLVTLRLCWED